MGAMMDKLCPVLMILGLITETTDRSDRSTRSNNRLAAPKTLALFRPCERRELALQSVLCKGLFSQKLSSAPHAWLRVKAPFHGSSHYDLPGMANPPTEGRRRRPGSSAAPATTR